MVNIFHCELTIGALKMFEVNFQSNCCYAYAVKFVHTYLISEAERDLAGKLPPPIVCGYNRNENIEKVLPSCVCVCL